MIKVGYLISYDYKMIFSSMSLLYNHVDEIYLAIDKKRLTWSGNLFELPQSFFEDIQRFDTKKKIKLYFDHFYQAHLTPIECDTRERTMLAKKMGKGWLLQIDVDEYIYNFEILAKYLRRKWYLLVFPKWTPVVFRANWITLYKQLEDGFLFIKNNETFPLLTNRPSYEYCRENTKITNYQTNLQVIHQSWARTEEEVETKLKNWSHRKDFNTADYIQFWKSLNSENYKSFIDFHPIYPKDWNKLHFIEANNIETFINAYAKENKQELRNIPVKTFAKKLAKKILKRLGW
ncbi:hypothetical protein [uncultured Flavobacterium sp.]|uniref:hypothetical protein n=1 Tax=uncultured Flavobacterium sp. TaxID=165435 RepID=UPI0030C80542